VRFNLLNLGRIHNVVGFGFSQHSNSRAGGTYAYAGADNQTDLDAKLDDGWFATLPEAIAAHDKPVVKSDDNAPPTRKELEAKAKELGIKFTNKTTDAELSAAITAALAKE